MTPCIKTKKKNSKVKDFEMNSKLLKHFYPQKITKKTERNNQMNFEHKVLVGVLTLLFYRYQMNE